VLSGIQPTSDSFHLGNYLGALRNWVTMQQTHDCFYCVVDLHAITAGHDPETLRRRTRVSAAQLLAVGIDPGESTLFVQSHVPEHSQLAWVFSCITGFGEASRMTQFKDKSAKGGVDRSSVGLFTYPILQAADILLYQADAVPVGEDQRQHVELSRDLAQRFNSTFGPVFTVPKPYIVRESAKIYDLQNPTAKMSKSVSSPQGTVLMLDSPKDIEKKFKRAVTDTETTVRYDPDAKPGVSNLLAILGAATGRSPDEAAAGYTRYGDLKADVAEAVVALLRPIQERYRELEADAAGTAAILRKGAEKAQAVAVDTLARAHAAIGLLPRP
jgi:tryptophanyl-tRNA synthetase